LLGGQSGRRSGGEAAPQRGELAGVLWVTAAALSVDGGESRAGRWEMEIRVVLKFPKIPGTKL